jgi:uncharacterized membrane protein YgcG
VRAAAILALVALILALNVLASVRVLRAALILPPQKVAWLALAWLVPLLGAALALEVSRERDKPAPTAGRYVGSGGAEGWVSGDGSGCGHGGDGGCGHGGGH